MKSTMRKYRKIFTTLLAASMLTTPVALRAEEAAPYLDETLPISQRIEDALSRMTLDEKIAMVHAQSKFSTPGCPRLGIPEIWMSDGPHGVRMEISWDEWEHAGWSNDSCTAMPALTCLAATFNPGLAYLYGNVVGEEARYRKKDIILGPGVNIYRTPLSGRNFEYMGEDPYLASAMVGPYVKGVQKNGVSACLKHFVLNNQENERNSINVEVGERALNEIYLPAFKAGVDAGVWSVMGSYNKFRGTYCSHNDTLVNNILKGEWGFDGVMITDWGSAHDTREAALNGLDIEMGSWTNGLTWGLSSAYDSYYMAQPLKELILNGEIDESVLDDKVRRILLLNFRTNMDRNRPYGSMSTAAHLETAKRVATEGIVLLKNENNTLPIKQDYKGKIAVIGENAVKKLSAGGGSSELKPKTEISPLAALKKIYGDRITYSMGYCSGDPDYSRELPPPFDSDSLRREAVKTAEESDIVIYIGGLNKNYRQDCEGEDRESFSLPYGQERLIAEIQKVNPNVVIVITSGNAVDMPWEKDAKAIIQNWYGGSMGGEALADIICGNANPSGKLPFTIATRLEDYPAHRGDPRGYPGEEGSVWYDEGIFIGYRWADTYDVAPRYPFGHGLSYTSFEYSGLKADKKNYNPEETIHLALEVENTGEMDGAESVQIYISQANPTVPRPKKELKAIGKKEIKRGEKCVYEFDIPVSSLAYYDDRKGRWVVEDDTYTLQAAASAVDIRNTTEIKINNNNLISQK